MKGDLPAAALRLMSSATVRTHIRTQEDNIAARFASTGATAGPGSTATRAGGSVTFTGNVTIQVERGDDSREVYEKFKRGVRDAHGRGDPFASGVFQG